MTIDVLIVDDSSIIRVMISKLLSSDGDINIVGTARNGIEAIEKVKNNHCDVILLDVEMPEMNGIEALPKILEHSNGAKVLMFSSLTNSGAATTMKALELGASDYLHKPSAGKNGYSAEDFDKELIEKIKALSSLRKGDGEIKSIPAINIVKSNKIQTLPFVESAKVVRPKAIAIGSSTGGPQAILNLLSKVRTNLAEVPIFITQHMPPTFTKVFASSIIQVIDRDVAEAIDGEYVEKSKVYVAPGDYHMLVEKSGEKIRIKLNQDAPENFCRPAVDPMLRSLSQVYGKELLIIMLTGMGQDGLEGCKIAVKNGATLIAQNEETSVVWGMPGAVAKEGLCKYILPLEEISGYLDNITTGKF